MLLVLSAVVVWGRVIESRGAGSSPPRVGEEAEVADANEASGEQPVQQLERVVGFFNTYRNQYPVSRDVLREIADQFHNWVEPADHTPTIANLDVPGNLLTTMDILRYIFFSVNWPELIDIQEKLEHLVPKGYRFNFWEQPDDLKI